MMNKDNHLGYMDKDPVRCDDSFAAFEEVLRDARANLCDAVLLGGDLFHDNKPTRSTLLKSISLLRKYTFGPKPIRFEVVSDQKQNFVEGAVNYEDEYVSVDLPVFSIHGNHDDPSRDGGTSLHSSLDVLSASKLVNYYGRVNDLEEVEISPVLVRKGDTRVALYGMGSLREERLNRYWSSKKVKFLRPTPPTAENDDKNSSGVSIRFNVQKQ